MVCVRLVSKESVDEAILDRVIEHPTRRSAIQLGGRLAIRRTIDRPWAMADTRTYIP